jgi:hypothetical protein
MTEPSLRKPRFELGDRVHPVGPSVGAREGQTGTVTEIIGSPSTPPYRYRVKFSDDDSGTFFGFELEPPEKP